MRKTLQCPKCDGRKLWRVEAMRDRGHFNQLHPLSVVLQQGTWKEKATGWFETFICAGCGYTEWYANGLDGLTEDPKHGVHFIDTEPEAGLR